MSSIDLIRMTLRNLLSRKARTLLTIIGVVIGMTSIVIMISIGIGMQEGFKEQLNQMGSLNTINVRPYNFGPVSEGDGNKKTQPLDDKAVTLFSQIEGVKAVIPFYEASAKLASGKYVAYAQVQGVNPDMMPELGIVPAEGRLLNGSDTLSIMAGSQMPNNFYNPKATYGYSSGMPKVDMLKDKLTFSLDMRYGEPLFPGEGTTNTKKPLSYKIKTVGVIQGGNYEHDYYIFMNITELKKLIKDYNKTKKSNEVIPIKDYSKIIVKANNMKDVQTIQKKIKDAGFFADSLTDILESMQKAYAGIQMVLGAIGAMSLLVAAIGITNTMVMSIYERTREIGIMKVIGAALDDIKKLFLFESGMLGFIGGLLGLVFSYLISFIINKAGLTILNMGMQGIGKTSIIPIWLAAGGLVFTTFMGIVSGYFPARRAMRLSALEAIKKD